MLQTTTISDITPTPAPTPTTQKSNTKPNKQIAVPIDSWEDEAVSPSPSSSTPSTPTSPIGRSGSRPQTANSTSSSHQDYPAAPPPTPVSPRHGTPAQWNAGASSSIPTFLPSGIEAEPSSGGRGGGGRREAPLQPDARPEKTTAVAGRLIAGALGVKAPKRSEEQRAYERAVREGEVRRREKEREGARRTVEEAERAKRAMWDD